MIIPKKVKIAGHIFKVLYPYRFHERDDIFGRIDLSTSTIYITNINSSGDTCSLSHVAAVFLHEVVHGIDRFFCSNKIGSEIPKEELVEGLAQGLTQFLSDNFEPLIPKKRVR